MYNPKWAGTNASSTAITNTFRWALNKVVDVNGNLTTMVYTNDSGILYLQNISYNGNVNSPQLATTHTVDFVLASRPDTNSTLVGGYRVMSQKRLAEIDVKASGANVCKYVLNYTNSPSTLRSLLASVTRYGSDYSTALPPTVFNYQTKPFTFGADTNWSTVYGEGQSGPQLNGIRSYDVNNAYRLDTVDMDGDGLPDRVMRLLNSPFNSFAVQRNTGTGFVPTASVYTWASLASEGATSEQKNSVRAVEGDGAYYVDFTDINGDGYPDRVLRNFNGPYTNLFAELNSGLAGSGGFSGDVPWGPLTNYETTAQNWLSPRYKGSVDLIDINGDGLPDSVSRKVNSPFDRFRVQLNTGSGFTLPVDWAPLASQGDGGSDWNSVSKKTTAGNTYVMLADINGDGLPDRVMRAHDTPYTNFVVELNNGAGFESDQIWGPVDTQGNNNDGDWGSPIGSDGSNVRAMLVDINGDGLLDHVMRKETSPYTNWVVQLNTGTGFAPATNWGPINSQGKTNDPQWSDISATSSGDTYVEFFDINGDGLPDRVMRKLNTPYDKLVVELNQGPFPDLLNGINNGLGGLVSVAYTNSTSLDNYSTNWVSDPWSEGAKGLLPFNVWVVSQVTTDDGIGNPSTTHYSFSGGYYNTSEREFRGFAQAVVIDPLGTKTITYFHQSGGRNNSSIGEYLDQGSESKKGTPFRIDVIGSDGATNNITLNKVEEIKLHTNGWFFPFVSQSIMMSYEGLSSYRAVAKQMTYDTNSGNLMIESNLGEVSGVNISAETFTDSPNNDSAYTQITYANLGNIKNKPADMKITSDSGGANRLRETLMYYDSRGNLTNTQVWLDTSGGFISTATTTYDQYGNPITVTDAAGITSVTTYDATYQEFPIRQVTSTFTNLLVNDPRSGHAVCVTDAKGLVASNSFDVFFRSTATYTSTNAYGAAVIWKSKTSYSLGGVTSGVSYNYVHKQVNDATDSNGFETYVYTDGFGRTIQSRAEGETGQFRVSDTIYDERGNVDFQTLPHFSSGSGFTILTGANIGTLTEYDNVGRAFRVTPAVQVVYDGSGNFISMTATGGDSGSPIAPVTTSFVDGNCPWVIVVVDSENKVQKSYRDAYNRVTNIVEVTASTNYNTFYQYDLLGNLTNVIDAAGNSTKIVYDSIGHKIQMTEPDLGTWRYSYDNVGRVTQQTDAKTNVVKFFYNDALGRLTRKEIWSPNNYMAGAVTNIYDVSDDTNYIVFKGQLYKTTDSEGYQRSSYDLRGRVIRSGRYLNVSSTEYTVQSSFDDADRVQTIQYPANSATVKYSYDSAGNLTQVKSLAGTGTQEIFYTAQGFNEFGQVLSYTNGNSALTTNAFYANSKRLQRAKVSAGAVQLQDLAYTYDKVSNLKGINDGVYTGAASATKTNILYDDLHRLTSFYSAATGLANSYAYSSIGNVVTNQDFGSGIYQYGVRPHAVTNANGKSYTYDACGNMITRGSQSLSYDEQNRLTQVAGGTATVSFGYAAGGQRLWKYNAASGTYTIWIGGIYEINTTKTLCHVFAGGKRICTFEPQGGGLWSHVPGSKRWFATTCAVGSAFDWSMQKGRAPLTMLIFTLGGVLCVCVAARRKYSKLPIAARFRISWWHQIISVVSIVLFIFTTTENVEAQTYSPVFYYYHSDNIGSSNVLTDRSGQRVQHYEYSAFGQNTFTGDSLAFKISNRYTGQIADDETGLYYYGARYYDPELGRFIQPDTMLPGGMNPQALNRYSYVLNNPLNANDPDGHGFFSQVAGFFKAIFHAEVAYWSSGETWKNIGIGLGLGGVYGAAGTAVIGNATTEIGASMGYVFGPTIGGEAAFAAGIAGTIVLAGLSISGEFPQVFGAISVTQDVVTAVGAATSVAASSAGFVGNQALAEYLGYASIAVAVAGSIATHWDAWRHPIDTFRAAYEQTADVLQASADNHQNPQINDNKLGHATNMSLLQRAFGPVAAPFLTVMGVGYELFTVFFPGHTQADSVGFYKEITPSRPAPFFGLFDGQHPLNWIYDTPGDLIGGNLLGQVSGLLFPGDIAAQVNKAGLLMPGPNYSTTLDWTKLAKPGALWPW